MLSEFELGLEQQLVEVALLLAHRDPVHVVAQTHLVLLAHAPPLLPHTRESAPPHLVPLLVLRTAGRLVRTALRAPLPHLQRQLQSQTHAALQQILCAGLAEFEELGLAGVGEVLEVEVLDGALDDLEGAEEIEQFREGAVVLVVLAELPQDLRQVLQVGLDFLALLQLGLEEGRQFLPRLLLHGLRLAVDFGEVAGQRPQRVVEAAPEHLLVLVDDPVRVFYVAQDEPALLLVELVFPAQVLLRALQRHHVPVLGPVAEADRADQLLRRPAVHRQRLLVLLAGDAGRVVMGCLIRILGGGEGGAMDAGPAFEEGMGRMLAVELGLGVLALGGAFLEVGVAGGRQEWPGSGLVAGAGRALVRVLVALDAVEADLVAAGGTQQVVALALAGVAASALLHRLLSILLIKIIRLHPRSCPLSTRGPLHLLADLAVIIVFQMSSIARLSHPSITRWLAQLGAKLEAGCDCNRAFVTTGCGLNELSWAQFQEDIWCAYRALVDLAETLQEERAVSERLAQFVSSLEVTNTELVEENRQLLQNTEEAQRSIEELLQLNAQLTAELQCKKQQAFTDIAVKQEEKHCQMMLQQLEQQLREQEVQIQQLQAEREEFQNELALKNTEIELAEIVIQEMRDRKALQLQSTLSPERPASCQEDRFSSEKQLARRHNSLMQDLVESQLVYEPCLSSQLFKSAETIQETVQDFRNEVSCLQQQSHVRSRQSKATWAHASSNSSSTQTDASEEWLCVRYYRAVKEKLVSSRIKK